EVGRLLGSNRLVESATRGGMERTSSACLGKCRRYIVARDDAQSAIFIQGEGPELRLANARGILPHRLENRPSFAPRGADDLEHVGGGGLLLQRLPQLVEQTRVLDRDNGLSCKIAHQLDLLLAEWPHVLAIDGDGHDERILLEHRHPQGRARAAQVGVGDQPRIAFEIWRHRSDVVDLHRLLDPAYLGMAAFWMNAEWRVLGRGECRRHVVDRGDTRSVSLIQLQYAELSTAQPGCILQHGFEYRLELAGRARDDTEDLRSRRLLLQSLAQIARPGLHFIEQPHVLDRDHCLIREGFDQLDLLVSKRPHCGPLQNDDADGSSFAEKRDPKRCTHIKLSVKHYVIRIGPNIRNMNDLAIEKGSSR